MYDNHINQFTKHAFLRQSSKKCFLSDWQREREKTQVILNFDIDSHVSPRKLMSSMKFKLHFGCFLVSCMSHFCWLVHGSVYVYHFQIKLNTPNLYAMNTFRFNVVFFFGFVVVGIVGPRQSTISNSTTEMYSLLQQRKKQQRNSFKTTCKRRRRAKIEITVDNTSNECVI